ncbi:DinB family protein [Micromonospora auratinigra]|uniref:DinB family protein n=1 Tax=Micromonospora auratinigra TaxID=261654 RepID=A0A1A8ZEJ5_9ACTN|nr:DinB family protein [Micromonospora auratinigra]SBT42224.1 Protein of unknown function (DUF664) [Micromonospora auratinigra]
MVFRSPVDRALPDLLADERGALTQQLDFHRATLLHKLDGLDEADLRRPMTPSGLSLLGLVKHLTAAEHGWFLETYAGQPAGPVAPEAEFLVAPTERVDELVTSYLDTCDRARAVVAAGGLDDVVRTGWNQSINLRAILVHMIEETARHNGHADLIREALDGVTGA